MPNKDIYIFLGNFEDLSDRELSFFKINLPAASGHDTYNEYQIAFTSNWATGTISIGIISRKPGYFYLALFDLDIISKEASLKKVVTE